MMRTPFPRALFAGFVCLLLATGCAQAGLQTGGSAGVHLEREPFGTLADGRVAELFTLTNAHGMEVRFTNYGGVITSVRVPDRSGNFANVALAYDSLSQYLTRGNFSSIVGRYANRIGGARFTLDGREYAITANSGPNHIHGGREGFARKLWAAEPYRDARGAGVVLSYTSPDGEEGFPGRLVTTAIYSLTNDNELVLEYRATTDRPTHVNLTHHAYFNLHGDERGDIFGHEMIVEASRLTQVDSMLIPTGVILPVANTPFDFRRPMPIGSRLAEENQQLRVARGTYDHNYVIDRQGEGLVRAVWLHAPETGRVMEVFTTEPGIQVYTGRRTGIALETQHFPDSPNKPGFPSTVLRPGQEYRSTTTFRFSVLD
jgi:aldose 1-epimerase